MPRQQLDFEMNHPTRLQPAEVALSAGAIALYRVFTQNYQNAVHERGAHGELLNRPVLFGVTDDGEQAWRIFASHQLNWMYGRVQSLVVDGAFYDWEAPLDGVQIRREGHMLQVPPFEYTKKRRSDGAIPGSIVAIGTHGRATVTDSNTTRRSLIHPLDLRTRESHSSLSDNSIERALADFAVSSSRAVLL